MNQTAEYIALAVAIHGVAVLIVNLTPTPRDNEMLGNGAQMIVKLYRAIELLAGIFTPLVKK